MGVLTAHGTTWQIQLSAMSEHTHTHPFNGPLSGTTQVSRYQKDKTNVNFTEARDSEWQWHQLGHMQVCTTLQTDNHASTSPLSFLQAGCPSCRPTNSVKALFEWYVKTLALFVTCWSSCILVVVMFLTAFKCSCAWRMCVVLSSVGRWWWKFITCSQTITSRTKKWRLY